MLRDLLTPAQRQTVYKVLLFVIALRGVVVAVPGLSGDVPGWIDIAIAILGAAGFRLADANVTPPPADPKG